MIVRWCFLFNMNYTEFLDYIFKRYSGNVKLGLDRMTGILEDMDNPQDKLHGIHVAGTNGKGSTCAACEALLLEHELSTGLNTSPHLIDYCERFRLNGKNINFATVLEIFHRFESVFSKWDASFFEITTAIAFQLFADKKVQAAVIEVGLGGRLDATNLFIPEVSAITTIGLDHVKTLGGTPELIAFEKAGIIKEGVPVILGRIEPSPLQVILRQAEQKHATAIVADRDFFLTNINNTAAGVCFDYSYGNYRLKNLQSNLLGKHQAVNIASALTAFLLYCERAGIKATIPRVRAALQKIRWQGRMQLLGKHPTIVVDGAHNLQGVEVFISNLKELYPGKKPLFVVSILADKDFEQMLKAMCSLAGRFYISKNTSERAAEIEEQALVVKKMGVPYKTAPSVRAAFEMALADARKDDLVVGAGSLYTVAEIISTVQNK